MPSFYTKTRTFAQDRLGTNIVGRLKKGRFSPRVDLERLLKKMLSQYPKGHPKVVAARKKLSKVRTKHCVQLQLA